MSLLCLQRVTLEIGNTKILRSVDLALQAGERLALIGPNGAGKSSLFDLISGRNSDNAKISGHIFLNQKEISGLPPHQIARQGLARSFQVSNVFTHLSVIENLSCAVMWHLGCRYSFWRRFSQQKQIHEQTAQLLDAIGLNSQRNCIAGELSYAEQRTLEMGMTVASGAHCILLDEPTAGMSRSETEKTIALIRALSTGKTLLMVEHDMQVVFELADRIAVMVHGEIIACDTPEKIRLNAKVQEAYLGHLEHAA
ncbi:ABC transporter ATP-binding protein [Undibacterium sp. Di24W]|uniref:ABC transporter ATP-binding protein n=1 Tax=Undibacterium sp. Di24W TaxID=3413033 RepID=UPI003BF03AF8